jgi:hypothetical protein
LEEIMANPATGETGDYNAQIINEFRANQGRVGGMWEGTTLILIHHIGAGSGIERITPVACSAHPPGLTRHENPACTRARPGNGPKRSDQTGGSHERTIPGPARHG